MVLLSLDIVAVVLGLRDVYHVNANSGAEIFTVGIFSESSNSIKTRLLDVCRDTFETASSFAASRRRLKVD